MSNRIYPDEAAHHEPSHLDLRSLQKPMTVKELKELNLLMLVKHFPANIQYHSNVASLSPVLTSKRSMSTK